MGKLIKKQKFMVYALCVLMLIPMVAFGGATFSRIKTWVAGETLTAAQLNAEYDNILNNLDPDGIDDASTNATAMQATADPYPGSSESLATDLRGEIQRLRYLIAQITGETNWYIDPDNTIAALATYFASAGMNPVWVDDYSSASPEMQTMTDPGESGSESLATDLTGELERLRFILDEIIGKTYWYQSPDTNIAALSTFKTNLENSRLGSFNRAGFTYNGGATAYTVKAKGASYYVKDKYAYWVTELTTTAIAAPGASDWYYLYLDYSGITSGTAITNTELIWSNTEPAWDDTYMGWYNGNDRAIFAVRTNSGPTNIDEFFHDGDLLMYADQITDQTASGITTDWSDEITLTIPIFVRKAIVTFRYIYNNVATTLYWRTEGQTGTTGHYVGTATADTTYLDSQVDVIVSSNLKIDVKETDAANNTLTEHTGGWYFPDGM